MKADASSSPRAQQTAALLTVAINAQVDPERAGGVESALAGLVTYLAREPREERYLLLSTERFGPSLERLAGDSYDVLPWPYPQKGLAPVRRLTPRWQRWRSQAGPLGLGVDGLHWGWWQTRRLTAPRPDPGRASAFLQAQRASVVHFPYPIWFEAGLPFLYEPWDLQHRHHPELFDPTEVRWRDRLYRAGCEQAGLVVTATRWTKRDIVEQYGIDPCKIAVIPRGPAVAPLIPSAEEVEQARRSLGLPQRFAVFPAMTFPHKNHLRLFEALAILRDQHGIILPLVCTGRPYEPHWPAIQDGVARYRLQSQVFLLGALPAEALSAVFKAASLLIYPSFFEGLGLPLLEAFEYGLPVLSSNATCLPEVAGDAALYFDPMRTESIVEALLIAERQPAVLERARAAAPAALARFSWPKAAATFVACYRAVGGAPLSTQQRVLYAEATES
jgi:glycosyltransferase involved in cell wall biosynthesis